jgi:hypothetical protein
MYPGDKNFVPGTRHGATNATAASMSWTCVGDPTFSVFSSGPGCPVGFSHDLSLAADGRAVLAHFQRLLLLMCRIYSYLYVGRQSGRDGDTIGFPKFP